MTPSVPQCSVNRPPFNLAFIAAATTSAAATAAAGLAQPAWAQLVFSDQTASAGLIATHQPGVGFLVGGPQDISKMLSAGAVGDFNNDGWQDLYVIISGGSPDRLFINNGDGTFTNQAAAWGVAVAHLGVGATAGDYNGDGWLDIYVTSFGPGTDLPTAGHHKLYRNNGNGTFTNQAAAAGVNHINPVDGLGPAFGDYDLDGDLDLFVAGWLGTGNHLYRNNGNGTFLKVTQAAGVQDNSVRGFAPRFVDMNGDRWPELLLAADFGNSRYYRNNRNGTFTNFTSQSGTGLDGNGMGQAVGDFNNDGLLDWYVTSIHSVNSGMPNVPGTGNMLYMNQGRHHFAETSIPAGVNDGGWGWGTVGIDFDHDGDVDLAATNGWHQLNGNYQQEWWGEQSYLFLNSGDATFTEEAANCGFWHTLGGRGMINFDYDNDGDQDVVIFANNGALRLFRNDLGGKDTHWLRVFLSTDENPRLAPNGFGTRVVVRIGSQQYVRAVVGGSDFLTQSELSAHFGLAGAELIDELRCEWADGTVTVQFAVSVDQTITVNSGLLSDLTGDQQVTVLDLLALINAWGATEIGGFGDLNADGFVNLPDLEILLFNWS